MRRLAVVGGALLLMLPAQAQDFDPDEAKRAFRAFRQEVMGDFSDFRRQCMDDYVSFIRNPWKAFEGSKPVPKPKEEQVAPVVMPEEERSKPVDDRPVVIDEVVKAEVPVPQPQPVEPVETVPTIEGPKISFSLFGTPLSVSAAKSTPFRLGTVDEETIARAFSHFGSSDYDPMLADCLRLRRELRLSDWAYLLMLREIGAKAMGVGSNEATLLTASLYMQSGYKMRLASDRSRLFLLYATRHQVYDAAYYEIDGDRYYGLEKLPSQLFVCRASFPKEQRLSLLVSQPQRFADSPAAERTIAAKGQGGMTVSVSVNKNLLDFYATYPSSMLHDNFMTRWTMYANTPMNEEVKRQLYPVLEDGLKGLSKTEAVGRLLNWVQTGFEYEYDEKVWGHDRAFFAEESLYYPVCDCEDRSILLTRLVRDLLGLKCILVYYPGHLASAIAFDEPVSGDYIQLNGKQFVIADGTYIGAPIGRTMTGMDNKTAKVILLD